MICLNQKKEDQTNDSFLKMMNLLLNSHISAKEKKKILQTDYHIPMTIRLGEELNLMCNLSDLVEEEAREKALKEGHAKGRAKGRAEGIEEGKITTLVGLVADKILSVDEAAKRAGVAKKDFLKYLN
jgi:predicted transposase YdaD